MAYGYVQGTTGANVTSGTSITASLTGVTAGNFLVAVVRMLSQTRTVNSISGGGTWVRPAGVAGRLEGSSNSYELWYCLNTTGGDITFDATISASLTGGRMFVAEYSGIKTTGAFVVGTGALQAAASSPQTVGPINVTAAPALIIAAGANLTDSRTLIAPSDTTNRLNVVSGVTTSGGMLLADKRVTATGNTSSEWTWTGGTLTGQLFIAAFEEEVSGPTITVQPTAQTKVLTNANTATFSCTATGTGTVDIVAEIETAPSSGTFETLANGSGATWTGLTASGSGSASISTTGTFTAKTLTGRTVRLKCDDSNGTTYSNAVLLTLFDGPQVTAFGPTDGSGVSTATLTCDYVTGTGEAIEVAVVLPDGRVAVTTTTTA